MKKYKAHLSTSTLLLCLSFGCSEDSAQAPPLDMGTDESFEEMHVEEDIAPDIDPTEIVCTDISDCPRHYSCNEGGCSRVLGCVWTSDAFPEAGCSFDHGEETDNGYFSAAECRDDSDCTNPSEPNCIAWICSRFTPCEEDADCSGEETCRLELYCRL